MSAFQQAKLRQVETVCLGKDALHICLALAVFGGPRRRSGGSLQR